MTFASFADIRVVAERAFRHLPWSRRVRSRIHVSGEVIRPGTRLGPKVQGTRARRGGILAFCDFKPGAGFAHPCCYLLFDPRSKQLVETIDARYPPYPRGIPERYFERPILSSANRAALRAQPVSFPKSVPAVLMQQEFGPAQGVKYALLYSGGTNVSHLNDLDCCYRVLLRHGFDPNNILVCNFDGSINASDWHGDTRASSLGGYALKVTGDGRAATFLSSLESFQDKLGPNDSLFIYTTGHGDSSSSAGHYLLDYDERRLTAQQVSSALRRFTTKYRSLIVVMQQCCSGGFESWVLRGSTAALTSFTASTAGNRVAAARDKPPFYSFFTWHWLGALNSGYLDGEPLLFSVPANGAVTLTDAFKYAVREKVRHPSDKPQHSSEPDAAQALRLR